MRKKIRIFLIVLTTLANVTYASFPVSQDVQTECISETTDFGTNQPVLGILSLSSSIIGVILVFTPAIAAGIVLNLLSIIFGVMGLFTRKSRVLSITGILLSLIFFLVSLLIFSFMILGAPGAAFGG